MQVVLASAWIAAGSTGCANKPSDRDLVLVSPDEAMRIVQEGTKKYVVLGKQTGVWVDSRSEADYRQEHIHGAINLPYERVTEDHKLLDKYEILVVYGNDYNDARANGMSKRLMALGHGDVRTLNGGLRAWKSQGNPVETANGSEPRP